MHHFQLGYIDENTNFCVFEGEIYVYYKVKSGDNLSKISSLFYGSEKYATKIFEENKKQIGSNPNIIKIGEYLELHSYDNKLSGYLRSKGFDPNLKMIPFLETPAPLAKSNDISFSNFGVIRSDHLLPQSKVNYVNRAPDSIETGLKTVSDINSRLKDIVTPIAQNVGNSRVGNNFKFYYAKHGTRAFYGNQYVKTHSLGGFGKASKVLGPVGYAISVGQIGYGVYQDDGKFGYHAQKASAGAVGSWAGGYVGAKAGAAAGAAIGALFGGVGAVPGAIIGGIVGGIAGGIIGGKAGEAVVNHYYE